jgi:dimethylglycine dehydrogenase
MAEHVRVAVIGGGAVGCSALYHLAKLGWRDAVLLEQDELTSGSTWHAAGNCPTFSTAWGILKLQQYSADLYRRLAADHDHPIGYHVTGSLRLSHSAERLAEFRHVCGMAQANGIDYAVLTSSELRARYPLADLHDLNGALWDPLDGDIDPAQLTQALAAAARSLGARVRRFCKVVGLAAQSGGGWTLHTNDGGELQAEVVVNAAGYRAGEVMRLLGEYLPTVTLSHQYLVTEHVPELAGADARLPLLRDPDTSWYLRQERGGFLLGPYERDATPMWQDGIPADFAHKLFNDDLARLEPYIADACARVPALGQVGVRRVVNGPIPYSPDGNPYVGPAYGRRGFFHCNTFSFGICQAGGAGKAIAEWVVHGAPEWDLWALDPRRYTGYATSTFVIAKAVEVYQHEYAPAFPNEERPAGRPLRSSPLYARLAAKGARFGARGGWERATWFAGPDASDAPSFKRQRGHFAAVGAEVRAVREAVSLLDLPGFTKFFVSGAGAAAWLDWLLCSRLPRVGRIALAYALDGRGRLVSEFTVTRLAEDRFYLCSASAAEWHDADLLQAALPADGSVRLEEISARMGTLVLAGPHARDVLGAVTRAELSSRAFPWLAAREIEIGAARVLALRVNYVGELGWELHAPTEHLLALYEALEAAGAPHGMRDIGIYAVDSLRLEKCYRAWKTDLETGYSPLEAGLDRFVDLAKPDFVGRAALLEERQRGVRQRLVPLVLDEAGDHDAPACASAFHDGARVGIVTSGGWSYTMGRSLALAYVRADLAAPGSRVEVEVYGERRTATVGREPLYDPGNARLRA